MTRIDQLTDVHLARLEALCAAVDDGHVTFTLDTDGATLHVDPRCAELLAVRHGGKREALKAAQQVAADHERPSPRSTAALLADPVLAALTIHQSETDHPAKEPT